MPQHYFQSGFKIRYAIDYRSMPVVHKRFKYSAIIRNWVLINNAEANQNIACFSFKHDQLETYSRLALFSMNHFTSYFIWLWNIN